MVGVKYYVNCLVSDHHLSARFIGIQHEWMGKFLILRRNGTEHITYHGIYNAFHFGQFIVLEITLM